MSTCFDEPGVVFDSSYCLSSVSKDARGEIILGKAFDTRCDQHECSVRHTMSGIKVAVTSNKSCDSKLGSLLDGSLTISKLATGYDTDGLHRGVHAGDFVWNGTATQVRGRISGITNAGILRARPFQPACEKCSAPGVMIGRLCGQVVKARDPQLKDAQVVAVYRLLATKPSEKGAEGAFRGTIEGVVVTRC